MNTQPPYYSPVGSASHPFPLHPLSVLTGPFKKSPPTYFHFLFKASRSPSHFPAYLALAPLALFPASLHATVRAHVHVVADAFKRQWQKEANATFL